MNTKFFQRQMNTNLIPLRRTYKSTIAKFLIPQRQRGHLQIWRVPANILTADKGYFSDLGVFEGLTIPCL